MTFRPWWSLWCSCCFFWDEFISQVSIRCSQARWGYGNIFYPFPWQVVLLRVIINWQPLPLSNVSVIFACLVLVLLVMSQMSISGTVFTSQLLSVSFLWFLHFSCHVPRVEHLLCCPWSKNSEKTSSELSLQLTPFLWRGVDPLKAASLVSICMLAVFRSQKMSYPAGEFGLGIWVA